MRCGQDGATNAADLDGARLREALTKAVADVQVLLTKSTPQARQALRKVLVEGRLACTPLDDGRKGYAGGLGGHLGPPYVIKRGR